MAGVVLAEAVAASGQAIVAVDGTPCDLTSTLVGRAARVTCLIPPGANPHNYQMKPSDRQTLAGAALVGSQQPTRHRRDLAHASPWVFLGLTRVGSGSLVCDAQTDDRAERGHGEVCCPCPEPWPVRMIGVGSCVVKG